MSIKFNEVQTKNVLTFLTQYSCRHVSFLDEPDALIEISLLRKQINVSLKPKSEQAPPPPQAEEIYQLNEIQTKNTLMFLTQFSCRNLSFLDDPDAQIEIALLRKQIASILNPQKSVPESKGN